VFSSHGSHSVVFNELPHLKHRITGTPIFSWSENVTKPVPNR
jgi:hypothetical protein